MNKISILLVGNIEWAQNGIILRASSTVTLIQTKEKNILIDTASRRYKELLAASLSDQGLAFDDIDRVICTHHHGDHTGNIQHFKNAEIYLHKDAGEPSRSENRIDGIKRITGEGEILPGIYILETPGHTRGHISVKVSGPLMNCLGGGLEKGILEIVGGEPVEIVCAGDALPTKRNYYKQAPPGINYDPEIALASMKKIVDSCEIAIPGHDVALQIK